MSIFYIRFFLRFCASSYMRYSYVSLEHFIHFVLYYYYYYFFTRSSLLHFLLRCCVYSFNVNVNTLSRLTLYAVAVAVVVYDELFIRVRSCSCVAATAWWRERVAAVWVATRCVRVCVCGYLMYSSRTYESHFICIENRVCRMMDYTRRVIIVIIAKWRDCWTI